ncbi:MAG TPA: tRNA dihydrouridine(20/20a) synthase DusA [Burkholderiaceae bacterium]
MLSTAPHSPWRLCVAPMMEWTDRHCRYFHRLLSPRARLYTEMVTTGALLHGDVARHLDFSAEEHPLALQLGGSEPSELAHCARLAQQWGYDEVNLNCGCPSPRVQRGAFGACLMAEPALVRDCVAAMRDAVSVPVTVKHRIGIDRTESYAFVRDFVGTVGEGGCSVFIVHARNAWLDGLSPKGNREVPPLRHETVVQLKADFPQWTFVVNGGLHEQPQIAQELARVDGVMLGRVAYHDPWRLVEWEGLAFGDERYPPADRDDIEARMVTYMAHRAAHEGTPWTAIARHMMGLRLGQPGARRWRQVWSDHGLKALPPAAVADLAARARHDPQTKQALTAA